MIRGCCGLTALLLLCGCGGYVALNADPNLPDQVVAGGAAGVGWLTSTLSRAGASHPVSPPSDGPIALITPSATPAVSPTPTAPTQSSTSPTSPASSAPISVSTPLPAPSTPTPAPSYWTVRSVWSASDLAWAVSTLTWDEQLDTAAETRFPASAAYYAGWAAHWADALAIIHALTWPQTVPPPAAYYAPPEAWYALAITLHRYDELTVPADKSWDDLWVANYQRLTALWGRL